MFVEHLSVCRTLHRGQFMCEKSPHGEKQLKLRGDVTCPWCHRALALVSSSKSKQFSAYSHLPSKFKVYIWHCCYPESHNASLVTWWSPGALGRTAELQWWLGTRRVVPRPRPLLGLFITLCRLLGLLLSSLPVIPPRQSARNSSFMFP